MSRTAQVRQGPSVVGFAGLLWLTSHEELEEPHTASEVDSAGGSRGVNPTRVGLFPRAADDGGPKDEDGNLRAGLCSGRVGGGRSRALGWQRASLSHVRSHEVLPHRFRHGVGVRVSLGAASQRASG